jgi:tetratricopeptide (TPR) repeat protein
VKKKFLVVITLTILAGIGLTIFLTHWSDLPFALPPATEADLAKNSVVPASSIPPAESVLKPIDLSKPIRLAIGGMGLADNDRDRQLGDLATVELTGAPGFVLVERASLDAILGELNLSWSGFVRAKDAVRVGKLLKVDWFLLGTEAGINGTNSLVVRLVDAHTGIMRDAALFPSEDPPAKVASELAAFARRTRDDAAKARQRVYLAVGGFEDLSVNNRRADFVPQLRGYLTAAYRGGNVTLLEREYVETLLQEMRLDIAGLTEEEGTNSSAGAQSAFWLIRGRYQSYETTNFQLEVSLNVQRVFGRSRYLTLRGVAGDPMDKQIKGAIDEVMSQTNQAIVASRSSEARSQMSSGKDLIGQPLWHDDSSLIWGIGYWTVDSGQMERRRRNFEEAIRAFETVLLLEPTNREAKVFLGVTLRDNSIEKIEEARRYYFEIIENPIPDRWSEIAKAALSKTFEDRGMLVPDAETVGRWYEGAAMRATNATSVQYFRSQAESLKAKFNLEHDPSKAQELAFTNAFNSITNAWLMNGYSDKLGLEDYVRTFGTNRAAAVRQLAEFYPKFTNNAPNLAPFILASMVTAQVETNSPIVIEFEKMFDEFTIHPERISNPKNFWWRIWPVIQWSCQYKDYGLAIKLLEGKLRFTSAHPKEDTGVDDEGHDKVTLAYAYFGSQKWDKALAIFESYSNQPLRMGLRGPWGDILTIVYPREYAEYCREKLQLPSQKNSKEFGMGKAMCFCLPTTFTLDEQGLWFGGAGELIHLDFELKTNEVIKLPLDGFTRIAAICIASSNIWIATGGGGLIEYDKNSKKCRRFTVKDGMMMDAVAALHLVGDTLWIGYGRKADFDNGGGVLSDGGGLGKLDISANKFVSFGRSLASGVVSSEEFFNKEKAVPPPKTPVIQIRGGEKEKDDVWILQDGMMASWLRFEPAANKWTGGDYAPGMDADSKQLVLGQLGPHPVSVLDLKDNHWRHLDSSTNFPSGLLTTITLDGDHVWVGGLGFVGEMDASHDTILHVAYIKEQSVDRIQIGGGYVWAQCRWLLYRAPLPH